MPTIRIFFLLLAYLCCLASGGHAQLKSFRFASESDRSAGRLPAGYRAVFAKEVVIDADYEGGFKVMMKYGEHKVKRSHEKKLKVLHNGKDITMGVDRRHKVVSGYAYEGGVFVVAVSTSRTKDLPCPDVWPPFTEIAFKGDSFSAGNEVVYISTLTAVTLVAEDDRRGKIATYYTLDMTDELFETGFIPGSVGRFRRYRSAFSPGEGEFRFGYASADISGNYELLKTVVLRSDGTSPVTLLRASGKPVPDGERIRVSQSDIITLSVSDPLSRGVASGVSRTVVYIDIKPTECRRRGCPDYDYKGPFTLIAGEHVVHYRSFDKVGNAEKMRKAFFFVERLKSP